MKACSLLVATALIILAALTLQAAVPQQISYQGRLTSSINTPITGAKNLTFKIYSGAGVVLWNSGTIPVTCIDGLFSVMLGTSPQPVLPGSAFTDTSATLGITVESDPELTPRTRLTSAAFAYTAQSAPDYLPLTGGILTGPLHLLLPGGWHGFMYKDDWQLHSGVQFEGAGTAYLTANGNGGFLTLGHDGENAQLTAWAGTLGSKLELLGYDGHVSHRFDNWPTTGNEKTVLPDNSISAPEVWDEPGLASSTVSNTFSLTSSMIDLATVTVTIPASGYITLEGTAYAAISGTSGRLMGTMQIDEAPGGHATVPYFTMFGKRPMANDTIIMPVHVKRTYYKMFGTYTFRLEAEIDGGAPVGGSILISYPTLQATYYTTSYGDVSLIAAENGGEYGAGTAVRVPAGTDGRLNSGPATVYQVNLRDLELKAAKAEAVAQKARLELLEAQSQKQTQPLNNIGLGEKAK